MRTDAPRSKVVWLRSPPQCLDRNDGSSRGGKPQFRELSEGSFAGRCDQRLLLLYGIRAPPSGARQGHPFGTARTLFLGSFVFVGLLVWDSAPGMRASTGRLASAQPARDERPCSTTFVTRGLVRVRKASRGGSRWKQFPAAQRATRATFEAFRCQQGFRAYFTVLFEDTGRAASGLVIAILGVAGAQAFYAAATRLAIDRSESA
jgi:hypothetical protein